ncbi:glutaminase A [Microcoleus sp. FACHB-831]|uniref:glutaminase A n=1 Tax=Microcoleus sp. FACHB-831 TaxID=2692827 RepID=UPI0016841E49|nr:glutaminase A [Microcoleus sp. FACHB-831]MBD1922642.1 glutaminase A [Microcoleus sp. FACHB-831]
MISSTGLSSLTQGQLDDWVAQAQTHTQEGKLPGYIPRLFQANPNSSAVQIQCINGQIYSYGDITQQFVLMSVIKPFVLLFLLEHMGTEAVFERVGMKPSDQAFNSLAQLEADGGWPRNPMINSGAIALASLLPSCELFCDWLNQCSNASLVLDEQMLASVISTGNQCNRSIAMMLAQFGHLNSPETALDIYNRICCLSGNVVDLAKLGMLLADGSELISLSHSRTVNALMTTCGLYEASGRFAVRVGLPTKSGVSGAMLSIVPSQGAIACYSPPLDLQGNSVAGLFLLEQLARSLNLSVFS